MRLIHVTHKEGAEAIILAADDSELTEDYVPPYWDLESVTEITTVIPNGKGGKRTSDHFPLSLPTDSLMEKRDY
jgi:hypothetical protein